MVYEQQRTGITAAVIVFLAGGFVSGQDLPGGRMLVYSYCCLMAVSYIRIKKSEREGS